MNVIDDPLPARENSLCIQGTMIYGDFLNCKCPVERLTDRTSARKFLVEVCRKHGFGVVGTKFKKFTPKIEGDPESYTGVVVLSESHVAVHSWPEISKVHIDVFTCNVERNNSVATRALFEEIKAWYAPSHSIIKTDGRY